MGQSKDTFRRYAQFERDLLDPKGVRHLINPLLQVPKAYPNGRAQPHHRDRPLGDQSVDLPKGQPKVLGRVCSRQNIVHCKETIDDYR